MDVYQAKAPAAISRKVSAGGAHDGSGSTPKAATPTPAAAAAPTALPGAIIPAPVSFSRVWAFQKEEIPLLVSGFIAAVLNGAVMPVRFRLHLLALRVLLGAPRCSCAGAP